MNTILLNENKLLTAQNKKLKKLLELYQIKYKDINIEESEEIMTDKTLTKEEQPSIPIDINESLELCSNNENNEMEIVIKESHKILCLEYDLNDDTSILSESICTRCKCDYVYCKCNKHNVLSYY